MCEVVELTETYSFDRATNSEEWKLENHQQVWIGAVCLVNLMAYQQTMNHLLT